MVGISLVVKYMKGREIRHFGLWKKTKNGSRTNFMDVKLRDEKTSWFV